MTAGKIVDTVKEVVAGAKSKAEMVGAHGKEVVQAGAQTLKAAKDVVVEGKRQAGEVLTNTKAKLKRTLKKGAAEIGDKLARIATPNRKEQAVARKSEVKAKKQRKLAEVRARGVRSRRVQGSHAAEGA